MFSEKKEEGTMFSEEEIRWVLGFLVPFMIAAGVLHFCGYRIRSFGDPVVGLIMLLIFIGNSLYFWENKRELLKRFALALPFSLLPVVLLGLTVFELSDSWVFGVLMFILLTAGKENLKRFFAIRLVIGTILIGLLAILVTLINSVLAGPVK